jgi:hypothetical protein
MQTNPYPTYHEAAQEYLRQLHILIQLPREENAAVSGIAVELQADMLIRQAEEIADISASMMQHAHCHLDSKDPMIREGIRGHLIDQATAELLLVSELLQIGEEKSGVQSTAAVRATQSATLRDAINAAQKSSSVPIEQGLPTGEVYRDTEFTTIDEAAAALKLAIAVTAGSISRRVQELGRDIAFDLMTGAQWMEAIQGEPLSSREIARVLKSIRKKAGERFARAATVAAKMLLNVHEKIAALSNRSIETDTRGKIREWLVQIKQADRIDLFDRKVDDFLGLDVLHESLESSVQFRSATLATINEISGLIRTLSDKFLVMASRMRKLEDAIRLAKLLQIPPLLLTSALQVSLLAALVYSGRDFIENSVPEVLREQELLPSLADRRAD